MLSGVTIGGLGFIILSYVSALWNFYLAFVVISIGFSASSGAVGQAVVANWFIRQRGRALGLLMAGFGLSGLVVPVLVWLIDATDWRTTVRLVGAGVWVIGIPVGMMMRHRPEDMGLLPDGDDPGEARTRPRDDEPAGAAAGVVESAPLPVEVDFSVREALGTRAFWLMAFAYALGFLSTSAVVVHEIPFLSSVGFSRESAALVLTMMTLLSVVGRLGFGWLADYLDKRWVLSITFTLQSVGVIIFSQVSSIWVVIPFLLTYGPGYGGGIPVRSAMLGEYFGRYRFGTLMGLLQGITSVGAGLGPLLAGVTYDAMGSYRAAFLVFGLVNLLAVPAILASRRPQKVLAPEDARAARSG